MKPVLTRGSPAEVVFELVDQGSAKRVSSLAYCIVIRTALAHEPVVLITEPVIALA